MPNFFDFKTMSEARPASVVEEVLMSLSVEPSHTNRTLWFYYDHDNFQNGNEVWLEMLVKGGDNLRLPLWLRSSAYGFLGFATNTDTDNTLVPQPGSLFWNNPDLSNDYSPVQPLPLPSLVCHEVRVMSKAAAGTVRCLLAVQSLPENPLMQLARGRR